MGSGNLICINARSRAQHAASMRKAAKALPCSFASILEGTTRRANLEEYKKSFERRLLDMPIDPSRVLDDVRIELTDSAYEAMRADPEYESWILGTIRRAIADPDPDALAAGGKCVDLTFGASKTQARLRTRAKQAVRVTAARSSLAAKKTFPSKEWRRHTLEQVALNAEARAAEETADTRSLLRHVGEMEAIQGHHPLPTMQGMSSEVLNLLLSRLTR